MSGTGPVEPSEGTVRGIGPAQPAEGPVSGINPVQPAEGPVSGIGPVQPAEGPMSGIGPVQPTESALSGIGPVEPGEGTWDALDTPFLPRRARRPRGRLAELYDRHRRAALGTVTAVALLAGGGYLYATRPRPPEPPPPPYPSQVTDMHYLSSESTPAGAPARSFSFGVELTVLAGPPVTVNRISQPYAGLSVKSTPTAPFRTTAGSSRKIVVTMHVTQCRKVPWNAGLPFLDVTLRNTRAIEVHSFILGQRYAQQLSEALQVACSNDSG
jgi:hypothetical protein